MMDFVLTLHSHLPYVLHHGRWPHGSDWLCEAALDTYLPLVEELQALEREGIPAPITIGVTPVLANQLAHPDFATELEHLLDERLKACVKAVPELERAGEHTLIPLVEFWRQRIERLRDLFRQADGDLPAVLRRHTEGGRLEIIGSAATHGYLPLLAREESVRLQLHVGFSEHRRLFGRAPRGCWLPECAYRPDHAQPGRAAIEDHLSAVGFEFFFVDSHLAAAGTPLGGYHDVPLGVERFDAERHDVLRAQRMLAQRSPYWAYRVSRPDQPEVRAFVRDPRSSMQVWSRDHGYPGDEWYLEFHKIRWPGGLKLWRVTGPRTDLGDKQPYDPRTAAARASEHARHFVSLLESIATEQREAGDVIVAPFDTELFGHWWFEGIAFLGHVYRALARGGAVRPVCAAEHVDNSAVSPGIRLVEGSWGANGDHSMWLNDGTRWTWERLWPLEQRFWTLAPGALASEHARPVLAQAARALLLAQSSDWQFIISTGAVADYAEQRLRLHCADTEDLLAALAPTASADDLERARQRAGELQQRDEVFPDVLRSIEAVVSTFPPAQA